MIIRSARGDDMEVIAGLESELFGTDTWSSRAGVVAEVGGTVVGYAAVVVAADVADLARIAVVEERRRQGIASALLAAAHDEARESGARRMLLEVAESNVGARALYAAHGYTEIARRTSYYADGDDALVLERMM